jgi:hypothetical protein
MVISRSTSSNATLQRHRTVILPDHRRDRRRLKHARRSCSLGRIRELIDRFESAFGENVSSMTRMASALLDQALPARSKSPDSTPPTCWWRCLGSVTITDAAAEQGVPAPP